MPTQTDVAVFRALLERYPASQTRAQLVKQTHLPRTTVYDACVRLERHAVVQSYHYNNGERGRPQTFYKLAPTGPLEIPR